MTIKWGLSVSDWRDHAVDDHQDYPGGALKARCGHWLMIVTPLRQIVRETMPGMRGRHRRYRVATLRDSDRSPGCPFRGPVELGCRELVDLGVLWVIGDGVSGSILGA